MLADMNYNPLDRRTREQEGCGGMNVASLTTPFFMNAQNPGIDTTPANSSVSTSFAHYHPTVSLDQA